MKIDELFLQKVVTLRQYALALFIKRNGWVDEDLSRTARRYGASELGIQADFEALESLEFIKKQGKGWLAVFE